MTTAAGDHALRTDSPCCGAKFGRKSISTSPRLVVRRCPACKILWGSHTDLASGKPWDYAYLTDKFVLALRERREVQASSIASIIARQNSPQPILDYGSGQGVLLAHLSKLGLDAWGCDLDADVPMSAHTSDRTIHVDTPWAVPAGEWRTVVMLDVLEHHHDPCEFLTRLKATALLLKVPTSTGPAAFVARLFALIGRPGQLETLFLVGENAPHHWLATRRGVTSLARSAGWTRTWRGTVAEVGTELPERMRPPPTKRVMRVMARIIGGTAAAVSRVWSDTEVQYFSRLGPAESVQSVTAESHTDNRQR